MDRKKMMMTTVALGAAYLLRSKDSRQKLMGQMQSFSGPKEKKK
ncbi:hypothetical protein [Neobacillus terrae]|nr:hypothetical protein [Neobacillus terrae]